MKNIINISVLALLLGSSAHANATSLANSQVDARAMSIKAVSVREVVPTAAEVYSDYLAIPAQNVALKTANMDLSNVGAVLDQLITIGQKIFTIIQAGQPVVTVERNRVSVVPAGARDWTQLSGWQAPVTKVYEVSVQNLYGMTTADLRLKVTGNYGGGLNGHGHFLANVDMIPTSIYTAWGYNVDASVEMNDGVNAGTKLDPIAGIGVGLKYHVHTILSDVQGDQDFWITGAGELDQLD